jgi:hypothetical protein
VVCAAKNRETGAKVAIKKITPMCASAVDGERELGRPRGEPASLSPATATPLPIPAGKHTLREVRRATG